jgi:hypothetical protein
MRATFVVTGTSNVALADAGGACATFVVSRTYNVALAGAGRTRATFVVLFAAAVRS